MRMSSVVEAAILLEDYENAKEMAWEVKKRKENIASELCIDCKNLEGDPMGTIAINIEDAKRILQFIEDYYDAKTNDVLKKIERLN